MALTESQIYYLNSLTYAGDDASVNHFAQDALKDAVESGLSVGEYASQLKEKYADEGLETKYADVLDRIIADPTLSDMKIANYQRMEGSDANMIVFTSEEQSEAVVAFEGSQSGNDWRDNFDGVGHTDAPDGVSTEYQQAAYDYVNSSDVQDILSQYETITTTGHSKGGNNANYVALLDDKVDRSVTFDAPGFSDEFCEKYSDQIARKQDNLDNYSADTDYVNIIQNSIGNQHFIETDIPDGYEDYADGWGDPSFGTSHDPIVIEKYFKGEAELVEQDPGLKAIDEMLNSYLRYADDSTKREAARAIGEFMARANYDGFDDVDIFDAIKAIKEYGPELWDVVCYMSSYLAAYPDKASDMLEALRRFHPFLAFVVDALVNNWLVQKLVEENRPDPSTLPDGSDMKFESVTTYDKLTFDTDVILQIRDGMMKLAQALSSCRGVIMECVDLSEDIGFMMQITMNLHFLLTGNFSMLGKPETVLRKMASAIGDCHSDFDDASRMLARVVAEIEDGEDENSGLARSLHSGTEAPFR